MAFGGQGGQREMGVEMFTRVLVVVLSMTEQRVLYRDG
jgi:hypothetical protein